MVVGPGRDTDFTRAIHGRATDKIRTEQGLKNGRATIRVESWKLDFGLLDAAGGRNRHASVIPQTVHGNRAPFVV